MAKWKTPYLSRERLQKVSNEKNIYIAICVTSSTLHAKLLRQSSKRFFGRQIQSQTFPSSWGYFSISLVNFKQRKGFFCALHLKGFVSSSKLYNRKSQVLSFKIQLLNRTYKGEFESIKPGLLYRFQKLFCNIFGMHTKQSKHY